jgi:RNA polymerase sigma-70 factor (ECF subfamily)
MRRLLNRKTRETEDSSSTRADLTLVDRAQEGDDEAFEELVRKYQTRVVGLAYSVVRNADDALDVAQETFIKAHRNLKGFKGKSSFYTWIYRITVNMAIDRDRKRKRRPTHSLEAIEERTTESAEPIFPDERESPHESAADSEMESMVNEAIDALSARHREVVLLREIQGMSYEEIAEVVGCSVGTVMSRLHYARKNLKDRIRPFLGPEYQSIGEE